MKGVPRLHRGNVARRCACGGSFVATFGLPLNAIPFKTYQPLGLSLPFLDRKPAQNRTLTRGG